MAAKAGEADAGGNDMLVQNVGSGKRRVRLVLSHGLHVDRSKSTVFFRCFAPAKVMTRALKIEFFGYITLVSTP